MTYFMGLVWKVVMTWVVRNDLLYEISMKGFHDISCEKWLTLWDQYERFSWHEKVVRNDLLTLFMKGWHKYEL